MQSNVHVYVHVCGDIIHLCLICEIKITRTSLLLEEVMAFPKPEELLPIRSIPSVPALGTFIGCIGLQQWRVQMGVRHRPTLYTLQTPLG